MRSPSAVLVALAVLVIPAAAGADPSAASVLARVEKTYASIKTAEIVFEQEFTDQAFATTSPSHGKGWVSRPDHVRWEYLSKKGKTDKIFVSDGKHLTLVEPLKHQVVRQPVNGQTMPAALSFLTGKGTLAADFTAAIAATTAAAITLELTPKTVSAAYAKLTFVVDPATFTVRESIVTDSAGNTNRFTFSSTKTDVTIDPRKFKVDLKSKKLRNYSVVTP
jgi:outer membrane lipoprotein-sorting protein